MATIHHHSILTLPHLSLSFASSRKETEDWVLGFFALNDSLTTTQFGTYYSVKATAKYGNNADAVGLPGIQGFFGAAFKPLKSMKHKLIDFHATSTAIYAHANITYHVKGDPEDLPIVVEGMGVCHLVPESERVPGEGIVRRFECFLDVSPMLTRVKWVAAGAH